MSTTRIRWEPNGYGGFTGHVGTMSTWVFQVWETDGPDGPWRLNSALPGLPVTCLDSRNPDALKAEAERWLAEFTASLGAVFPEDLPVTSRCECGGLASHHQGCRWREGYGSRVVEPVKEVTR